MIDMMRNAISRTNTTDMNQQYSTYLNSLNQLLAFPQRQQKELSNASRIGADELHSAESYERDLQQSWKEIDRLQRELNDKVGRLSQVTGVFLQERPPIVQHNSSKDLIVDFRSMLQRVESLNSSQSWINELNRKITSVNYVRPAAPIRTMPVTSSSSTQSDNTTQNKPNTKMMIIAGIAIVAVIVVIAVIMF